MAKIEQLHSQNFGVDREESKFKGTMEAVEPSASAVA
jgi:hypothetical protein